MSRAGRAAALLPVLLAAAGLAGCAHPDRCLPGGAAAAGPPPPEWRAVVTPADHTRLRGERDTLLAGVAEARAAGFGAAIDGDARLFDPDYSQDNAALPPGAYRCRTTSLGSRTAGRPALVAEPAQRCAATAIGALVRLEPLDGTQRAVGRIYPELPGRLVFLGTIRLADEHRALHYGRDADRDVVGVVERIGPARWRLTVPRPAWEATVLVTEIVPAG